MEKLNFEFKGDATNVANMERYLRNQFFFLA